MTTRTNPTRSTFSSRNLTPDQWNSVASRMHSILRGTDEKAKVEVVWRSLLWVALDNPSVVYNSFFHENGYGATSTDFYYIAAGAMRNMMDPALWERTFVKNENGEGAKIIADIIYRKVPAPECDLSVVCGGADNANALVRWICNMMPQIISWARSRGGIGPYDGNPYSMDTPKHLGGHSR